MAYTSPTADFVTTSLNGDITDVATSMTIGTGLNLPATNGVLQIDYDSVAAVGAASGPETITYTAYVTGTGAVTGMVRGAGGTTGVTHDSTASIQSGMSSVYLQQSPQYDTWNAAGTLTYATTDGPTFTATITGDSTTSIYPGVRLKSEQTQAIQNYWSFDANSADSKGGATMGNIGTPTYAAGKFSNALTLNGTDQALSITDAAAFKPTDNFTIGCWFKMTDAANVNTLFQSYSDNTNAQGIRLYANQTTGTLVYAVGNGSASDTTVITGTTNAADGNWHDIVLSVRNNYAQLYLNGKLEASGYSVTPTYNATNYVRIGCCNVTGSNVNWHKGQIDDLFIAAYALDEQTIAAKYAAATAQGTGDLTLTKYFLCTASSYSAPNTTVTLYGGTDHTLMPAPQSISNAYYSTQKAPYGFPLNPDKWKVQFDLGADGTQNTPTQNTWYNLGGSISVPIGNWELGYSAVAAIVGTGWLSTTLSTANNTTGDQKLTAAVYVTTAGGGTITRFAPVKISAKATYYLNTRTANNPITTIDNRAGTAVGHTLIRATSTLL